MSLLSSSHQELKIQREALVANGFLGAFHIFRNVAPFSADPITFSVRAPNWLSGDSGSQLTLSVHWQHTGASSVDSEVLGQIS